MRENKTKYNSNKDNNGYIQISQRTEHITCAQRQSKKRKRFIDNKWQQWCAIVILCRRYSSSKILVKMYNQTTVNNSSYQQKNRKCLKHLRKNTTQIATATKHFCHFFFYFNSRYDLNVQQKFIAFTLIGISILVNCQLIVASNSSTDKFNQQYTNNIINNNMYYNVDGRRYTVWNDFQKKILRQQSVPAYQSPQDLGDILTQLGVFIQTRQRNATELATNIFFKYYNS